MGRIKSCFSRCGGEKVTTRALLDRSWHNVGVAYVAHGIAVTAGVIARQRLLYGGTAILSTNNVALLVQSAVELIIAPLCLDRSLRQRGQAALSLHNEGFSAAAAIAALISESSAGAAGVVSSAQGRMKCITFDKISAELFTSNVADNTWYEKSENARAGSIDAFLSHSWHDNPHFKWKALQEWRQEFVSKHHREPRLWIDKCCIDQSAITADLANLPVYLASCQQLLVIAGPTYLERLWCVVELFCFVQMNRKGSDAIHLRVLPQIQDAREHFAAFDAWKCKCFLREDYERLLGCVEAASGSMSEFNQSVRGLLAKALQHAWIQRDDEETGASQPGSFRSMSKRLGQSMRSFKKQATMSALGEEDKTSRIQQFLGKGVVFFTAERVWIAITFLWVIVIALLATEAAPMQADCIRCQAMVGERRRTGSYVSHGSASYRLLTPLSEGYDGTLTSARKVCAADGAVMTSITSDEEASFVQCLAGTRIEVWLGLSRPVESPGRFSGWEWDDPKAKGALSSYERWESGYGEPNEDDYCALFELGNWFGLVSSCTALDSSVAAVCKKYD